MSSAVALIVDSTRYEGWKSLTISKSMETLEHTFQVDTMDRWEVGQKPIPIREGDLVDVEIGGQRVVSGFVDEVAVSGSRSEHRIAIAGASHSADLVDSSALRGRWKDTDLRKICDDLVKDFTVKTVIEADDVGEPLKFFKFSPGETVYQAIQRAARMRGLLCTTNPAGDVVLTRPASEAIDFQIRNPGNVEQFSRQGRSRDRFSVAYVLAQGRSTNKFEQKIAAGSIYQATDAQVLRYRPILVEGDSGDQRLKARGDWEVARRSGSAQRFVYTIPGWTVGGVLWDVNMLVPVDDDIMDVDDNLLVADLSFSVGDDGGELTTLELAPRDAFIPEPPKALKRKRRAA